MDRECVIMGTRGIIVVKYGDKIHSGYVSYGVDLGDLGKRLMDYLRETNIEKSDKFAINLGKKYATKVSDFPPYVVVSREDDFFKQNTTMREVEKEDYEWMYCIDLNDMKFKIEGSDHAYTFDLEKPDVFGNKTTKI